MTEQKKTNVKPRSSSDCLAADVQKMGCLRILILAELQVER